MPFSIYPPLGFTYQGQRENNEDSIYPAVGTATSENCFFIVCDGVGGAQKGELASHIAVSGFADYLNKHTSADFSEAVMDEALAHVQRQFDEMLSAQHLLRGMATTFTLVAFGLDAVHVGHIGDSRIYQIRNGSIVYKSEDHSKVNYLLKAGLITAEQAQNHPERNVIMRAIQGSHKDTSMELYSLTDVQAGDYFFQCTDGVLENVNDAALCQILESEEPNERKLQLILNLCEGNTRDNYSGYLVQVADMKFSAGVKEWLEPMQTMAAGSDNTVKLKNTVPDSIPITAALPTETPQKGNGLWYLGILVLMAGIAAFLFYSRQNTSKRSVSENTLPSQTQETVKAEDTSAIEAAESVSDPSPKPAVVPVLANKQKKQVPVPEVDTVSGIKSNGVTPNSTAFGKSKGKDTVSKKNPGG